MKHLIIVTSVIVFLFSSCEKESKEPKEKKERIEENVTIRFNNGSGSFTCGEFCGTTIEIINGDNYLKSKNELPDSITSKWEYWNREYIVSIKFLEETCHCKNGDVEPYPPGSDNFPTADLKVVEIIKIKEK